MTRISMGVHFFHSTAAMPALLLLLLLAAGQFLSPASGASSSSSSSSSNYKYYCDWCSRHSTASLSPPAAADHHDGDACGYGAAMGTELPTGVHAAAASAEFFRRAGCGACYQLRCRDRTVCGDDGVRVVVTDVARGEANRTGFMLAREAFATMARRGMSDRLTSLGNVHVEFKRVPCDYGEKNLTVRVEKWSRNPGCLAIRFLYQGGQTDIADVEIAQVGSAAHGVSWRSMVPLRRRVYWRTPRAPAGPLQLRLVVTAGSGGKWLRTAAALPADWRPGGVYDTGLRVTDVAMRTCSRSCATANDDNEDDELR